MMNNDEMNARRIRNLTYYELITREILIQECMDLIWMEHIPENARDWTTSDFEGTK